MSAVPVTPEDLVELLHALKRAFDEDATDITISLVPTPTAEMPSSHRPVHYAGFERREDGSPRVLIWVDNAKLHLSAAELQAPMILAIADTGYAGAKWKTVFDQLGTDQARIRFTEQVQSLIENFGKPG